MADVKTDSQLLEEIAANQGVTLKEAKAAVAEAAVAKKQAEDLTAKIDAMQIELKAKDATIGDILTEVKEQKARGSRPGYTPQDKRKIWLGDAIAETIGRNGKEFKAAADGGDIGRIRVMADNDIPAEQKALGPIQSANLTGTGNNYISYLDWQPGMEPLGQDHFRRIFRVIQSETDFVRFPRANSPIGEGSFGRVNEGSTKPQIDRDYTMIDLTLKPMAGYAIVSRQSLRNIVFLQSWLPTSMMEQLMDSEDTDFANTLVAAATGSATTTGFTDTSSYGKFLAWMTKLRAAKYTPDFIAGDPMVWANLLTLKSGGTEAFYQQPGFVTVTADGQVRILGIPFYPVNWLTGGRILMGDSRKAAIVQSEGLILRQTDSHASTFITNEITFLLERTEGLAVFRPDAFVTAVIS
jgi:HK97 family phage major capsid protein